jgi:hypothetical protein
MLLVTSSDETSLAVQFSFPSSQKHYCDVLDLGSQPRSLLYAQKVWLVERPFKNEILNNKGTKSNAECIGQVVIIVD